MSYTINIINNEINRTTIIELTDAEVIALKYLKDGDEGIINYIKGALDGIVHKCIKLMRREWEPNLKIEYESLPTNDYDFINLVTSRPDYKDAKNRLMESEEKLHPNKQ